MKHHTTAANPSELAAIAQTILNIETLETRDSDDLDFHEVSIWSLKAALEAAYRAGQQTRA
jgi:hypothetical protein